MHHKTVIFCTIGMVLFLFGSYLIINSYGWKLFWGIFILLWANNMSQNLKIDDIIKEYKS